MWKITPLDLGQISVPRRVYLCTEPADVRVDAPIIAWLLTSDDGQPPMLVDCGPAPDHDWSARYHNPLRVTPEQLLPAALRRCGIDPTEIATIIITHLHWDHAYGMGHCPNAKIYIQLDEWKYAADPSHKDAQVYETSIKSQIPFFFEHFPRFELISGDYDLASGLKLLTLPGHSPGSQGVLVETAQGTYLIAGDMVNRPENLHTRTPGGIHGDLELCAQTYAKILATGATVLPTHDYSAFDLLK